MGSCVAIAPKAERDPLQMAANRMVTERDGIILALIRHVLRRPGLEPDDIGPGRLRCVSPLGGGDVTWVLDGKPIAVFCEPEAQWGDSGREVVFTQTYKVLL